MSKIDVQFMYFEDCPSHQDALKRLRNVLKNSEIDANLSVERVDTHQDAQRLRFRGSPSIWVNGVDIDPNAASLPVGLACRAYRKDNGAISPLPPESMIQNAVLAAQNFQLDGGH